MNTEKLKELIANSDSNQLQKNVMISLIERVSESESSRRKDRELIEKVGIIKNLSEVVLSTDDVKIYTVRDRGIRNDENNWDLKYPYRSIFKNKKGEWERSNIVSPCLDTAYLVYLESKYLGCNSKFSDFAIKMLEIKIGD